MPRLLYPLIRNRKGHRLPLCTCLPRLFTEAVLGVGVRKQLHLGELSMTAYTNPHLFLVIQRIKR